MSLNLHIYPSPFRFESRMIKETKSLVDSGICEKIIIVSTWESGLLRKETLEGNRHIHRVQLFSQRFKKNKLSDALKYAEFIAKVYWTYRRQHIDYVNCHSLLVLLIGVLLKRMGNSRTLIYDAHELETERVGLTGIAQKITKILEKYLIDFVDKVIVVCEPIADWYRKQYKLTNVHVVQNMPYNAQLSRRKSTLLKDKFKISPDEILFIYQGVLMSNRGLEVLLDVFAHAPSQKHIVFMGYGNLENKVRDYANRFANIHFQEAVTLDKIVEYTSSADVGVNFITGELCLSYKYSLPNKFGEYIIAGIPVMVSSSLSYLSKLVTDKRCGWSVASDDSKELTQFVHSVNQNVLQKVRDNVYEYATTIGWEFEEKEYFKIYN